MFRVFEEWLESKMTCAQEDTLPVIEDNVEWLAHDLMHSFQEQDMLTMSSEVLVQIRIGHVYTYHQLEDGQPLIAQGMEELFQQFPLFVELTILSAGSKKDKKRKSRMLLSIENCTVNPGDPYRLTSSI